MTQDVDESGGRIRPRPLRIVLIAGLAAIALTLAYPMSARKSAHAGNQEQGTAASRAVAGSQTQEKDPQLSFSMRTVVRPVVDTATPAEHKASVAHPADSAPKFEGYVTQPAQE